MKMVISNQKSWRSTNRSSFIESIIVVHGEGHWVFGGIERGSNRCFLVEVEQRDANTLLPLIEEWILPGTKIMSDGWHVYNNIDQGGIYTHDVVIHQDNFVDPLDRSIHSQNIESMWSRAKRIFVICMEHHEHSSTVT